MSHDTSIYKLGSEIYSENLASILADLGNEVHIFQASSNNNKTTKSENLSIHHVRSNNIPIIGSYLGMKRSLRSFEEFNKICKFDWVFIVGSAFGIVSSKFKLVKIGFIIIEISKEEYQYIKTIKLKLKKRLFYFLLNLGEQRGLKNSNLVLCNTTYQMNKLIKNSRNLMNKLIYSPIGLPNEWFDSFSGFVKASNTPLKFIYIGAGERRILDLFLKILFYLKNEGYNVAGIIVRENKKKVDLLNQKLDLDIEIYNNISRELLINKYRESLALILPTYKEAFCIPILEAATQYVPTICSNIPQISDLIDNDLTGILVESNELSDWIYHVKRLINMPGLLFKMREGARKKSESFRLNRIAEELNKNIDDYI